MKNSDIEKLKLSLYECNKRKRTVVGVGNVSFGKDFIIIGGPCCIENEKETVRMAKRIKDAGAMMLRGGAFKPRTSPYDFQGLGFEGLKILKKAKLSTGLLIVTEVLDTRDVESVAQYADVLQIGARNMQNISLLKEVGCINKPVILKRGMCSTLVEWLNSAEYILSKGNSNVILCERGIRTFETYTRNTLDLSIVPAVKGLSHLPVIVDPSHSTGRSNLIEPLSLAAVAVGADGLLIEVHENPEKALCDGNQSISVDRFTQLIQKIKKISEFMNSIK